MNIKSEFKAAAGGTAIAQALFHRQGSPVFAYVTDFSQIRQVMGALGREGLTADLAAANNLRQTSVLRVGQKLIIPSKPGQPVAQAAAPAKAADPTPVEKPSADSTRHVVKPGETLGGIARKYGVKQGEIAVANNITDPRKIQPGQELIIPAKSASTGAKQAKSGGSKSDAAKAASPADEDLDAGLKPPTATEVPVVKIDDSSTPAQPNNP